MNLQAFWSRLTLVGEYVLDSPLRIGTGGDGVALDSQKRPLIPASSFRGALRAYVESTLRGLSPAGRETRRTVNLRGPDGRPTPTQRTVKLCCDSVDKREDDLNYQGCLTRAIVSRWEADPVLRPQLDAALVDCTCQVCRLFGTPWLAGRVRLADLRIVNGNSTNGYGFVSRGGLSISRDTDTAIEGSQYQRQAIPAGTRFSFYLTLENATPAEQGMILVGLRAFEAGLIGLGADRSRGLGRGHLAIDWWQCRYVDADQLLGALLVGTDPQVFTEDEANLRINALADLLRTS
jgi:CRISPR-associated RAMP protein (TIGR02581 family)